MEKKNLEEKMDTFMGHLSATVRTHPSVNHRLYDRLINGQKLDRNGLFRLCVGYHDMAQGYLKAAATAILYQGVKDQRTMIEMTKTLHSELGFGHPEQVHHEYFLLFPQSQGIPKEEILNEPPVQASERYNQGLIKLFSGDLLEFLGAQTAFEMDAKEMIHKVHEAARRYTTNPGDLSYFHLHLWFEDAHVNWAEKAMGPYITDCISRSRIERGFKKELKLKEEWLDGLYKYVFDEPL